MVEARAIEQWLTRDRAAVEVTLSAGSEEEKSKCELLFMNNQIRRGVLLLEG